MLTINVDSATLPEQLPAYQCNADNEANHNALLNEEWLA